MTGANIVVNSAGTPAVKVTRNARITAPSVGVVGTVATPGKASVANLTTGIDPVADPLAGLQAPSVPVSPSVPSVAVAGTTSRVISPGVYRKVSVSGGGRLTLRSGTYVILESFTASGNAIVSASNVSLFLACAALGGGLPHPQSSTT